jgi:transposase
MKKHSKGNGAVGEWRELAARKRLTIGIDLGDKVSRYCVIDEEGAEVLQDSVKTTPAGLLETFGGMARCRVAIEVGSHSRWVNELLTDLGQEVLVADPRRVPLISASDNKSDGLDAEMLARLARVDPKLLHPIRHRGMEAQKDLTVIRARQALVEARTKLINCARGLVKTTGVRIAKSSSQGFGRRAAEAMPELLRGALAAVSAYDEQIEQLGRKQYPETARLQQVNGVGALTALTFVLTVEDPHRFRKSRDVGCYFGLRPKRDQSGDSDPQLGITKAGDPYMRQLLVNCAHHILGPFGAECKLRRWGLALAQQAMEKDSQKIRAGKKVKKSNAKKRAITAVARKLAVLLHRLWVSGDTYEPWRGCGQRQVVVAA